MKTVAHRTPLLEVRELAISFPGQEPVVRRLHLTVQSGEVVAVVGASGAGKSLLANAIMGLLPSQSNVCGTIKYEGKPLTEEIQKRIRGKGIALIPQSITALNPLMKAGKQVRTAARDQSEKRKQRDVFKHLQLSQEVERKYPFQLSGGMQRRVLASTAMVSDAPLLIADEPTPGLDQHVLHETASLFRKLADRGQSVLFMTHDLRTALAIADKVVVVLAGETIENLQSKDFSADRENVQHPYTKALWQALPENGFASPPAGGMSPLSVEPAKSNSILEAKNLHFRYPGGPWILQQFDIALRQGEVVGLYGSSGRGKTTLAKLLSGYERPCKGEITLDGQGIKRKVHPAQLVLQHPEKAVNPRWRIKQILQEGGAFTEKWLATLGIQNEWLERFPNELSGGQLQRVCLARALAARTPFMIADEMTTMLDAVSQAQIWQIIMAEVEQRRLGVLAISHDLALLQRISHRMVNV